MKEYIVQGSVFYLIADFIEDGIDKHDWYMVDARNSEHAVMGALNVLERQGKDVQCITEVIGVNSMAELADTAMHGPKPGILYIAHVFDELEEVEQHGA